MGGDPLLYLLLFGGRKLAGGKAYPRIRQMASFVQCFIGHYTSWSPKGRWIAFDAYPDGNADIYVISADGDSHRLLTTEGSTEAQPSWSRDGKWIYFNSNRTGIAQVWKTAAAGGEAVQVTKKGGGRRVRVSRQQVRLLRENRRFPISANSGMEGTRGGRRGGRRP